MAEIAPCEALIKEFTENYIGKVFYYCLRRTNDSHEAEDLASDIAVNIFSALNKGTVPKNFSAWVWQIAKNRYSVWADWKHRERLLLADADMAVVENENSDVSVEEEFLHAEQLAALRRELAFVSSDYRGILIAYYFENRKVQDIANSLGLTKSAVESRLFRARKILKGGMDMERKFGKRSYNPEQVAFAMKGMDGKRGQPWAIITHLLYKNVFLETYENPQTAKALSLELGVALPYMEDELEFLVREQLLTKIENQYQTAFPIISKEEQRKKHDNNKKNQKALTDKICALINTYINEDGSKVNYNYIGYEAAKWAIIVHAFDWLKRSASQSKNSSEKQGDSCPTRPDDGA